MTDTAEDAVRWLDARPPAPPLVRSVMDEMLEDGDPSAPVPDRLANAALRALRRVVREPSQRSGANTLLAADALLTYACEAAAEAGLDELDRLTRELDFQRFSDLMPVS